MNGDFLIIKRCVLNDIWLGGGKYDNIMLALDRLP